MTRRIAIATCFFLFGSALPAQSAEWQLTPTRAGKIILGMTIDSLHDAVGRENVRLVDLMLEGQFSPALQVYQPFQPGSPLAIAEIVGTCGFRVSRISAVSPLLRTADGLGVGSTIGEVRKRYPAARIGRGEGSVLIVEPLQMSFSTVNDTFADSSRVVSVLLWSPLPESTRKC